MVGKVARVLARENVAAIAVPPRPFVHLRVNWLSYSGCNSNCSRPSTVHQRTECKVRLHGGTV